MEPIGRVLWLQMPFYFCWTKSKHWSRRDYFWMYRMLP